MLNSAPPGAAYIGGGGGGGGGGAIIQTNAGLLNQNTKLFIYENRDITVR